MLLHNHIVNNVNVPYIEYLKCFTVFLCVFSFTTAKNFYIDFLKIYLGVCISIYSIVICSFVCCFNTEQNALFSGSTNTFPKDFGVC